MAMYASNGELYSLIGLGVYLLGGGDIEPGTSSWRSKKFAFPHATGFGWMRVSGPITAPVTVRLYVDGALIHTVALTTRDPARIPAVKGMRWEVEIESDSQLTSVRLSQYQPELFE